MNNETKQKDWRCEHCKECDFSYCSVCRDMVDGAKEKQRSAAQNKSGHKYWDDVANELEAQGITRKTIVKDLSESGVPITADFVKHVIWFHFMVGMFGKTHTPELTTKEWTEVEKVFTLHLREYYGLQTDYPSIENQLLNEADERYT